MINGGPPGLLLDLPGPPVPRSRERPVRATGAAEKREPSPGVHEPPRVEPEHQTFIEDELRWPEAGGGEERRRALFIGGQPKETADVSERPPRSAWRLSGAAGPLSPRGPNPVGTHNKLY